MKHDEEPRFVIPEQERGEEAWIMKDVIQIRLDKDFLTEGSIKKENCAVFPPFLKY